jgi:hypothetical protein
MSSRAKDQFWDDMEGIVDGFQDELKTIMKFPSYKFNENPEVEMLEGLEYEFKRALKELNNIKNKYEL